MGEWRRVIEKDDIPQPLWPMWDQLNEELERVRRVYRRYRIAMVWALVGCGGALTSVAITVARALDW